MSVERAVLDRMDRILALARRAGTPAEAAAATAKLNDLLERHNLTVAEVERGGSAGGAVREKAAAAGGMYEYQRRLWVAVAALYFCTYRRGGEWAERRGKRRWRSRHMLIGRRVNTAAALATGQYLESTAERLCRARLAARIAGHDGAAITINPQSQFFSSWAVAYREGVVDEVVLKLEERRERKLAEAAARAASVGDPTGTALTLLDVEQLEEQGNYDFVHGEGAWARKRAEEAEWARERAEEEAAHAAWAAANPEEARAQEAARRAESRAYWARRSRYGSGGPTAAERRKDSGAYDSGRAAGRGVGIDPQADHSGARRIGRG